MRKKNSFKAFSTWLLSTVVFGGAGFSCCFAESSRPNILIAISDDQSWPHASAYGSKMVATPNFDRIAREGALFTQAFCASPGCSPSRAALLTGLNVWQLEHAGTHASYFHPKFKTFPDRLAEEGYFVGHVGKGWGPGDFRHLGRSMNPAGPAVTVHGKSFNRWDNYADGFRAFLEQRPAKSPFCFWFGSSDPHRAYEKGSGLASGKRLADAEVPPFLPDRPEIRSDMLDYAHEVERFDTNLGELLQILTDSGELDKTFVIVTSDNGIPVPRGKANCYEYGIHMPLAIRTPVAASKRQPNGERQKRSTIRTVDDLVSFVDLTATVYDWAGVDPPTAFPLMGRSLRPQLESNDSGRLDPSRSAVYGGRERHSSSRYNTLSYPQRYLRTSNHLYIRNFKPERWPAGPGQAYAQSTYGADGTLVQGTLGPAHAAYHDIDACPSLSFLIRNRSDPKIGRFLDLAVGRRPSEELFDIRTDPGCLHNLANDPTVQGAKQELALQLENYLSKTNDPRLHGNGDVWETYPRVSRLRWFPQPDWALEHPESVPRQPWLDKRRPR